MELEARLMAARQPCQPRPPPPQSLDCSASPAAASDVGSRAATHTPESSADAIASGLFDNPPVADIGYFGEPRAARPPALPPSDGAALGASSNHAFFWSLSTSIENVSHRSAARYQELSRWSSLGADDAPALPALPPEGLDKPLPDDDSFPGRATAVEWTTRFFDTVGAVQPYVSEAQVLRDIDAMDVAAASWQAASRASQALVSIIFAQALNTLDSRSPEPFYRRALSLLDEQTVYTPTVDARTRESPCPALPCSALPCTATHADNGPPAHSAGAAPGGQL